MCLLLPGTETVYVADFPFTVDRLILYTFKSLKFARPMKQSKEMFL